MAKNPGIIVKLLGYLPASRSRTFHLEISDSLLAITEPVEPAPMMMKSNVPKSRKMNDIIYKVFF